MNNITKAFPNAGWSASGRAKEVRLSHKEASVLRETLAHEAAAFDWLVDRDANRMAEIGAAAMSCLGCEAQTAMSQCSETSETLVIRGAWTPENLPPTPVMGNRVEMPIADMALLGLMRRAGFSPVSYRHENGGELIRNVVPNPARQAAKSSHGSREAFGWHSDNPIGVFEGADADPVRTRIPRVLAFIALRNHEKVSTDVLPMTWVEEQLSAATLETLSKPVFTINAPSSNQLEPLAGVPLRELSAEGAAFWRFAIDDGEVAAMNEEATSALAELRAAIDLVTPWALQLMIACGDMVIFDNYRVTHRRRGFNPGPAAQARWLRRCYGLAAPEKCCHPAPVERPFMLS